MKLAIGQLIYIVKDQLNFANFYVLLLVFNAYSHLIGEDGIFITQIISIINILVSFYCIIKLNNSRYRNSYIKLLKRLLILFSVYGIWLIITNDVQITSVSGYIKVKSYWYLMEIYSSILPIFSIYYFSIKNYFRKETLVVWLFIFMLLIPIIFIKSAESIGNDITSIFTTNRTSNIGYAFVAIIPAISLFNNKLIYQFLIFAYCMAFTLICMKRGPIIICLLCLIVFVYYKIKNVSLDKRIIIFVFLSILLYVSISFIMELVGNNAYFMSRIEDTIEGGTSGRDSIYSILIDYYFHKANIFQQLFGLGAYGTLKISHNLAHNDWLEILIGQGLFGVLLYTNYWLCFYKKIKRNRINQEVYLAMTLFFIIYSLKTLFSMSINDIYVFSSLFFSYYLAQSDIQYLDRSYLK